MTEIDRIHFLLNNPTEGTQEDANMLENEIERHPYAQYLRVLLAKLKHHISSDDKSHYLTKAAVYSSDRLALKKVITEPGFWESIEEVAPFQDLSTVDFEQSYDVTSEALFEDGATESATIFDEVLKNLEKLKSLRKQFQFLELGDSEETEKLEKPIKRKKAEKKAKVPKNEPELEDSVGLEEKKKPGSKKKKLDDILIKDEVLDSQINAFFLKEIEDKKETVVEENSDRKQEQNDIIEKFIEEQPSIGSIQKELEKSPDEINRDLSEKSTKFGDDLVSENLAIILLKQGKRERAVDIYKKLIWKLPQKKAYFAARIEEIKK